MVSIHRPLGYGPSTLPLRHAAVVEERVNCPMLMRKKKKKEKEAWLVFRGEEKSKRPIRDLNP